MKISEKPFYCIFSVIAKRWQTFAIDATVGSVYYAAHVQNPSESMIRGMKVDFCSLARAMQASFFAWSKQNRGKTNLHFLLDFAGKYVHHEGKLLGFHYFAMSFEPGPPSPAVVATHSLQQTFPAASGDPISPCSFSR